MHAFNPLGIVFIRNLWHCFFGGGVWANVVECSMMENYQTLIMLSCLYDAEDAFYIYSHGKAVKGFNKPIDTLSTWWKKWLRIFAHKSRLVALFKPQKKNIYTKTATSEHVEDIFQCYAAEKKNKCENPFREEKFPLAVRRSFMRFENTQREEKSQTGNKLRAPPFEKQPRSPNLIPWVSTREAENFQGTQKKKENRCLKIVLRDEEEALSGGSFVVRCSWDAWCCPRLWMGKVILGSKL